MIETNRFKPFVPQNAKYLLIGSFGGKVTADNNYDWYYGTKRNHFWLILRQVFSLPLEDIAEKKTLFSNLNLAITDIILSCERKSGTNLDNNLINITYNDKAIYKILKNNNIKKIFFSSRFVEKLFRKVFKEYILKNQDLELITLPSPSPRYAKLRIEDKVKIYKKLMPKL